MVLVTGPTGSGKTTTLYAALNHVNSPDNKIITAEDPVEYRLGAHQSSAGEPEDRPHVRDDPAHRAAPRSRHRARRRDARPGDRRDRTARRDDGPPRVLDAAHAERRLGREPAARHGRAGLSRSRPRSTACSRSGSCARSARTARSPRRSASIRPRGCRAISTRRARSATAKFAEGVGCTYCNMTGYRGRVGIYELLEVDAPIADAIRRADLTEVERLAARLPHFVAARARRAAARDRST